MFKNKKPCSLREQGGENSLVYFLSCCPSSQITRRAGRPATAIIGTTGKAMTPERALETLSFSLKTNWLLVNTAEENTLRIGAVNHHLVGTARCAVPVAERSPATAGRRNRTVQPTHGVHFQRRGGRSSLS